MKRQFFLVPAALVLMASCSHKNTDQPAVSKCDTNAIIKDYLIKNRLIDDETVNKDSINFTGTRLPLFGFGPGILYTPAEPEYSQLIHKDVANPMITDYNGTRPREVLSFLVKGTALLDYLNNIKALGLTDVHFILAQQPKAAGLIDDVTMIIAGIKDNGNGTWSHIYDNITVGGVTTRSGVLQHIKPILGSSKPSTVLE